VEVTYLSDTDSAGPNEDFILAAGQFVIVLDGATAPPASDSGCIHGVPWLVRQLATEIFMQLADNTSDDSLADVLAVAIRRLMKAHGGACDLSSPHSPSSTVAILREQDETLDYLVLCDSPIVIETAANELVVVNDDRTRHLKSYEVDDVAVVRNTDEGFWVASTEPEAAYHALAGAVDRISTIHAAVMTDGLSRLVGRYHYSWGELMRLLTNGGPRSAAAELRALEEQDAELFRGKDHDDLTVAFCRMT
jgi:Protein phosphatase 2C